jgi:hypothetical protein
MSVTHLKIRKKPVHKLLSAALTKMDVHGHKSLKKSTFYKIMLAICFLNLKLFSDKKNAIPEQKLFHFLFCLDFYLSYVINLRMINNHCLIK